MERRRRSKRISQRDKKLTEPSSIDRLSGLPDDVLVHILSFLRTKHSVSTSVLAKRWRFLWAHVPNLVFEKYDFRCNRTLHSGIIDRVMMLHKAKVVNTFRLCEMKCSAHQLETWITSAIQRSAQNLYLDFQYVGGPRGTLFTLPRCVLTCKTLVDLKLCCCRGIPSSGDVFLPRLKKLHLRYSECEDDNSIPHLLSGCPVLQELIISYCFREEENELHRVVISSPTIKKLDVQFSYGCQSFDHMLTINAPALQYLAVQTCSLEYITSSRRIMTSLIEAKFVITDCFDEYDEHYNNTFFARTVEFLSGLCNLKCLTITGCLDEKLVDIVASHVKFDNLTKLEIEVNVSWHMPVKFLEVADNLEDLILILDRDFYIDKEPIRVPTCILSRLRTVRIDCFDKYDFDIVRYLLKNAQVLERMEIYPLYDCDKKKLDSLRRISLFERGSKSCQVAFY